MAVTAKKKAKTLTFEFDDFTSERLEKWLPHQELSLFNFIHAAVNEALDDVEDKKAIDEYLIEKKNGTVEVMEAEEFWKSLDD